MRTIRDEDDDVRTVAIEGVWAKKATSKALLCDIDGKETWIPQSCIHDDSEVYQEGDEGKLVLLQWFAEKEGLA